MEKKDDRRMAVLTGQRPKAHLSPWQAMVRRSRSHGSRLVGEVARPQSDRALVGGVRPKDSRP